MRTDVHVGSGAVSDLAAQQVLDARGYLVIWAVGVAYLPGEIITDADWRLGPLSHQEVRKPEIKLVVIAETDCADYVEQIRMLYGGRPDAPNNLLTALQTELPLYPHRYYRVIAE